MSGAKSYSKATKTRRGAKSAGPRGGPPRRKGAREILERQLARRLSITMSGEPKRVTALEAILLQLMQKALAGHARAGRVLLDYQTFATSRAGQPTEMTFVESGHAYDPSEASSGREHDGL